LDYISRGRKTGAERNKEINRKGFKVNWNIYRKCNGNEMILIASLLF